MLLLSSKQLDVQFDTLLAAIFLCELQEHLTKRMAQAEVLCEVHRGLVNFPGISFSLESSLGEIDRKSSRRVLCVLNGS